MKRHFAASYTKPLQLYRRKTIVRVILVFKNDYLEHRSLCVPTRRPQPHEHIEAAVSSMPMPGAFTSSRSASLAAVSSMPMPGAFTSSRPASLAAVSSVLLSVALSMPSMSLICMVVLRFFLLKVPTI